MVHIADLHLDHPFRWLDDPELRTKRRNEQKVAFRKALKEAQKEGACAVLVAGDLLEGEKFSVGTVNFLMETFESVHPLEVLIAAGNHDPMTPDSPYSTFSWPSNVRFMPPGEVGCFEVCDGLLVCGRSHARGLERANPLARFKPPECDAVKILLLHASYAEWGREEFFYGKVSFPLPKTSLERACFDYVALGHHHSHRKLELQGGVGCYPGSPVALTPSETGQRFFVVVEVERGRADPRFISTGATELREVEVDCTGATSSMEVQKRAKKALRDVPRESFLVVSFSGEIPPRGDLELDDVAVALKENGFKLVKVRDKTVLAQEIEDIKSEESVRGEFVRMVIEEIEHAREEGNEKRKAVLEKALKLGLQAFYGKEVRI